ncbi:hypothetical protein TNCV_2286391 [Trichonephila clavipes]|nr:hypothetical protein TNCV_2286391 [Trichonephila clavipes]
MLTLWLIPQLQNDIDNFIIQLNVAPPHRSSNVQEYLNEHLPHRWIGQLADYNMPFTEWLPRCPLLTLCDFFLWV